MGKGVSRRGSFAALPVLIFAFVLIVSNAVFSAVSCGQSTFGAIVGVVKDPGQGAVANAELTLVNLDDRSERKANTDTNGAFEFLNLRPGRYELSIHAEGFGETKMTSLLLEARQTLRVDAQLKLASASETVEVAGDLGPSSTPRTRRSATAKTFSRSPVCP